MENRRQLSPEQREELLENLKIRFGNNLHRHVDLQWEEVVKRLNSPSAKEKLWAQSYYAARGFRGWLKV